MFNPKDQKLTEWFSRIPDEVRRKLSSSEISKWNDIILNWITTQLEKPTDSINKAEEKKEYKFDNKLLKDIVDFIFDKEHISSRDLVGKFKVHEEDARILLNELSELGFIEEKQTIS